MPHLSSSRWTDILLSVTLVGLTSLVGMMTVALDPKRLNRALPFLVSLAAGALLGVAGAHILPEAIREMGRDWHLSALLMAGFVAFFLVEKTMSLLSIHQPHLMPDHTHSHSHDLEAGPHHAVNANLLLGGAIHSFIDGMAVAIAYSANVPAGIATTLAVSLHEVPHHIGDVGVLIHGGLSPSRAVVAKLAATCASIPGVLVVLFPGPQGRSLAAHLLPVTAASFIYISLANLLPELQRERDVKKSIQEIAVFAAGILIMFVLYWLLGE